MGRQTGNTTDICKSKKERNQRESKKPKCIELENVGFIYDKEQFIYKKNKTIGEFDNFVCSRCRKEKKSRNTVTYKKTNSIICNGCYGFLLQSASKKVSTDVTAAEV